MASLGEIEIAPDGGNAPVPDEKHPLADVPTPKNAKLCVVLSANCEIGKIVIARPLGVEHPSPRYFAGVLPTRTELREGTRVIKGDSTDTIEKEGTTLSESGKEKAYIYIAEHKQ